MVRVASLINSSDVPFFLGLSGAFFNYSYTGKRYIPFVGNDDTLPVQLFEHRIASTTQNRCIQSITKMVVGKGLIDGSLKAGQPNNGFLKWSESVNNNSESLSTVLTIATDEYFTYGNSFVEIVKGEVFGTPFIRIYNRSMLHTRVGKENPDTGTPDSVIFNKNFVKVGYNYYSSKEIEIPIWNENRINENDNWFVDVNGLKRTCIHFKNKIAGFETYGLPPSVSGLRYQALEAKSADYNIENFDNGMVLSGMLIIKGSMGQEEADEVGSRILESHTGKGKTGRVAVVSSEQGIQDVEFKPYETTKEGSFIELDRRVEEKIIGANNWDKRLCGLDRDSGLSNENSFLNEILDVKELTMLNPFRIDLFDKVLKPIVYLYNQELKGTPTYAVVNFTNLRFNTEVPLSFYGLISPEKYVQVNEARRMANLPDDTTDKGTNYIYLNSNDKNTVATNVQP